MNTVEKLALMGTAIALSAKLTEVKASAWFKKAHIGIVANAFSILENDKKNDALKLIYPFKTQLVRGATVPDVKGDSDNGSGLHYYSPINKFGLPNKQVNGYYPNRLGGHSKSAGTMLEENYTMAVIFWQNGKHQTSAQLLGRAVHFLSDICCVPHTTSRICTGNPKNCHTSFEQTANKLVKNHKAVTAGEIYELYLKLSPREIANRLAEISSREYDGLVSKGFARHSEIASEALPLAQIACAALLNKFAFEVRREKLIDSDEFYFIKNAGSGLYLKSDCSLAQEGDGFRFLLNPDGSISLLTPDGELFSPGKNAYLFRITLCDKEERLFRMTCQRKFSKALIDIPIIKRAGAAAFKPQNAAHYWRFESAN